MNGLVRLLAALAMVVAAALPASLAAHDVPDEVTVLTFVKPEGDRLTLLVRAPLKSLRDIDIPMRTSGHVDLEQIEDPLRYAAQIWISDFVEIYENGERLPRPEVLGVRAALQDGRAFADFDEALAQITGNPLDPATQLYWEHGYLEIAYQYPIASEGSRFSIMPGMTRLGVQVNVILRMLFPDGEERLFDVHADVGRVELDPTAWQAFSMFAREGFQTLLGGLDYLLFIVAMVIPFRRVRPLVIVVASFTVAHSVTLIASAFGLAPNALWFGPLVGTLIAVSILWMALENILGAEAQRRWWAAFAFGLAYGFAFAVPLAERLQFAGEHLLLSVLGFNVGIEVAQLLVLAIAVPALGLILRHLMPEKIGIIILSVLVAHTAWHWMIERGGQLMLFPFPTIDALAVSRLLWWAIAIVTVAALLWLASGTVRRFEEYRPDRGRMPPAG